MTPPPAGASLPRPRGGRRARSGLLATGLGVHLFVVAHLVVGANGYARHVPVAAAEPGLRALQLVGVAGATTLLVGLTLLLLAGRRATGSSRQLAG